MTEQHDVVSFLRLLKSCMMLDLFDVRGREKNIQGLLDLGMDCTQRKEVLLGLEPKDYVKGPEPDDFYSEKEFWFFGQEFNGTEIYIKMRIIQDPKNKNVLRAMIWSFHPAKHKQAYPLAD